MPTNGQVIEEMVKNYKTYLDLSICKSILFKCINQMIYTYFKNKYIKLKYIFKYTVKYFPNKRVYALKKEHFILFF